MYRYVSYRLYTIVKCACIVMVVLCNTGVKETFLDWYDRGKVLPLPQEVMETT